MKKISIIIPLYNSSDYIVDCVSSCLKQTYDNTEIIVVDDGSTDDSLKVARKIAEKDKRVKVYHKENGGVSSARNYGIDKSDGEYICFIDADDCICETFIERMWSLMDKYDADFCFSRNTCGSEFTNKYGKKSKVVKSSEAERLLLGQHILVGCWNKMYRRSAIRSIRFHEDLFYGEGLYFINEVAHKSQRIVVCDDAMYYYRKVNPKSATKKLNLAKINNGEKSLIGIYDLIKSDGSKVRKTWSQHYCLFCLNAISYFLNAGDMKRYQIWRKKYNDNFLSAMLSDCKIKTKIKLIVARISPMLLMRMM